MSGNLRDLTEKLTRPPRVLVTDDDEGTRKLLAAIIKARYPGAVIVEATEGIAAVKHLVSSEFDLLFLDLMMPGMDGFDVLRVIRDLEPKPIIVVITGLDQPEVFRRCEDLGVFVVLPKPFKPSDIEMLIATAAARRR